MPPKPLNAQRDSTQLDDMAPPSDPASLLWAHQLKREHGHLLDRLKDLEATHESYDARIKATEAISEGMKAIVKNMRQMAMRITAIEEDNKDVKDWIKRLDGERQARMREDGEKVKKVQQWVTELETQHKSIEAKVQQASLSHRSIMEKIEMIESIIQKQGKSAEKLAKKNDPNHVKVLMLRLDAMDSRRNEELRKAQALQDRVASFERTCQAYNSKNNELQAEVARLNGILRMGKPQPLPSSEATTEWFQSSNPTNVQVPASPLPRPICDKQQTSLLEESPSFNAQQRKTARIIERPSQNAQVVHTQIETQTQGQSQTQDLDASTDTQSGTVSEANGPSEESARI
ncbi:hypothetical protein K469DRAFT_748968 [Zopfia rhizophila CBS 207.26]|uniref:Uncharacterized protein n=1 Tax=Zopfia rhizophila CBS 207.26 TaxID=1314779 RepID=A0A6A6E767_9PEZI|nr:hypothetical protein K469DRAFT_748968 [Zopfia rhizophila CBS 207.26]